MPIFIRDEEKILFIHIPKTGGTSIETWLQQSHEMLLYHRGILPSMYITPQHLQIKDIKLLLKEDFWDYSFAIVRNPYDRLESEFFFRTRSLSEENPDFSIWAIESINKAKTRPFLFDNHLRPQFEFIDSGVDIFRFEDGIGIIIEKLSKKLGIQRPAIIPKEKKSNRKEVDWCIEALTICNEFYHNDFETFGYEKIIHKVKKV